jgi:hypothetical protein
MLRLLQAQGIALFTVVGVHAKEAALLRCCMLRVGMHAAGGFTMLRLV